MKVYVVLSVIDMSDYCDSDYNCADEQREIEGIYSEYGKALEIKEKLEIEMQQLVAECECEPTEYIIEEWEVQ